MKKQSQLRIIAFSLLYFIVVGGGIYYFFFRPKPDKNSISFGLDSNTYSKTEEGKEQTKFSSYDAEGSSTGSGRMKEYFQKIKDDSNQKQRYALTEDLFGKNQDSLDQFGNPFDFGAQRSEADELDRQLQIRDSLNLLSYQEKRRREDLPIGDEILLEPNKNLPLKSNRQGAGTQNTSAKAGTGVAARMQSSTPAKTGTNARSVNAGAKAKSNGAYIDPLFDKNDPYYFHYPLDSSLTYQPLYQYTSDAGIWEIQKNYEQSLQKIEPSKIQRDQKTPIDTTSRKARQTQVNQNFPIQNKEYPDNYFTELSSIDGANAEPYFFDNDPNALQVAEGERIIGSAQMARKIKKLCACEVVGDQYTRSGRQVPMRIKEDCYVKNVGKFEKGTVFTALVTVEDGRMSLSVKGIIHKGRLYEFRWRLYDTDGREGIYVHNYNRVLAIPPRVTKDVYNSAVRTYEAAVVAYIANAQQGDRNLPPFEIFSLERLPESGLMELGALSLVKEIAALLENPTVFLPNKYKLYLDVSVGETNF